MSKLICPIILAGAGLSKCREAKCAWWYTTFKEEGKCSIFRIGDELAKVRGQLKK